jgi:ABC-type amino acid transport substrate-binding protein
MIAVLLTLTLAGAEIAPATSPVARQTAAVRCGAVERPGIAERGNDGTWRGVAVDLCRRIARATQGADAPIAFHTYRTPEDLRESALDSLAVLSAAELAIARPDIGPQTGPPVAISRQLLLVRANRPVQGRNALAGQRICFIMATEAEHALNAWIRQTGIVIKRVGFQEPVELRDALDAGYCAAIAADADDIPGGAAHTSAPGSALAELPLFAIRTRGESTP